MVKPMRRLELKSRVRRLPVLVAAILMALTAPLVHPAQAQTVAPPDRLETTRLIWTTLIAVDHANRTGNYSVLRDLAAPSFRNANNSARLAGIFAGIRAKDIGLDRVVLASPVLSDLPTILENGLFRVTGSFPFRPVGINFDLLYQNFGGQWKLFGVAIAPVEMSAEGETPAPRPKPK